MTIGKWSITLKYSETFARTGYIIKWTGPPTIASYPVPMYWWAHPYAIVAAVHAILKLRKATVGNHD